MKNCLKRISLKIATKAHNRLELFLDIFRTENGLVKRKINNHIMYLDAKDTGISRDLGSTSIKKSEREPAFMSILRKEVREGMIALDIGANIGYATLILAEIVGDAGQVYALEPEPRNFKILTNNIEVNGYKNFVQAYQIGASNRIGYLNFYVSHHSNLGSMIKTKHAKCNIEVPVTTMDDFFKDKKAPNFIKMDIEGHEVEALEGMFHTLEMAQSPVKILIEVHSIYYSENHSLEKQLRNLINIGFRTKYVISAAVAKPDFFVKHGYEPKDVFTTGDMQRGIYTDISEEDMVIAASRTHKQYIKSLNQYTEKIVRAIMIER